LYLERVLSALTQKRSTNPKTDEMTDIR
jgi:hypothetical protein